MCLSSKRHSKMFEWMNTVFSYDFLTFVYGNVLGGPYHPPPPWVWWFTWRTHLTQWRNSKLKQQREKLQGVKFRWNQAQLYKSQCSSSGLVQDKLHSSTNQCDNTCELCINKGSSLEPSSSEMLLGVVHMIAHNHWHVTLPTKKHMLSINFLVPVRHNEPF